MIPVMPVLLISMDPRFYLCETKATLRHDLPLFPALGSFAQACEAPPKPRARRADPEPGATHGRDPGQTAPASYQRDKVAAGIALCPVKGNEIPVLILVEDGQPCAVIGFCNDRGRGGWACADV